MTSPTPSLHQLIGGYVNQDLYEFYRDVDSAVDAFLAESTYAQGLPIEIDRILMELDDRDLTTLLVDHLGIGFIPEDVGSGGYRGWLLRVAQQARESVPQSR